VTRLSANHKPAPSSYSPLSIYKTRRYRTDDSSGVDTQVVRSHGTQIPVRLYEPSHPSIGRRRLLKAPVGRVTAYRVAFATRLAVWCLRHAPSKPGSPRRPIIHMRREQNCFAIVFGLPSLCTRRNEGRQGLTRLPLACANPLRIRTRWVEGFARTSRKQFARSTRLHVCLIRQFAPNAGSASILSYAIMPGRATAPHGMPGSERMKKQFTLRYRQASKARKPSAGHHD